MTATTADLRNKVAEYLRVKAIDQDLADEDASKIDDKIADVTNEQRELGLIWWADNAIPDACVLGMTMLVAAHCCTMFGKAGQTYEAGEAMGLAKIKALKPSAVIETVKTVFF